MSAIANITVFDGAASPVSHTLVAISVSRDANAVTAVWREQIAALPVMAQVAVTARIEQLKSGVYRGEVKTQVPVMESVSGVNAAGYTAAPKVAYVNTIITTSYFHDRSDITGRRLVRQLHTNLLGNISTSVAPVSTGPLPELFDLLTSPT